MEWGFEEEMLSGAAGGSVSSLRNQLCKMRGEERQKRKGRRLKSAVMGTATMKGSMDAAPEENEMGIYFQACSVRK